MTIRPRCFIVGVETYFRLYDFFSSYRYDQKQVERPRVSFFANLFGGLVLFRYLCRLNKMKLLFV